MAKTSIFRTSVTAAAVFALFSSLSGCGGGGGSDPAPVPPPVQDTTPPFVLANQLSPTPGVTIPRTSLIMTVKFSETLACPTGVQPLSVKANTGTPLSGNYTCVDDLVTATVTAASLQDVNLRSVEFELSGFADLAGNSMAAPYTWSYPVAPPPAGASVAVSATPNPITVGSSTMVTWTTTNAVSCVGSDGLSGSLAPAGGSVTVTPTTTTDYSVQCWNSANVATPVVTTTVTVNPAPAKHAHAGTVLLMRNFILHRVTPTGLLPNINGTPWQFYGAWVNLTAQADCRLRVSVRDNTDGTERKVLYSLATGETAPDTSAAGAALNRATDYVYDVPYDPLDHPEWFLKLHRPEGSYYSPYTAMWELHFQGLDGKVTDLTPGAFHSTTGLIQGFWFIPPCQ